MALRPSPTARCDLPTPGGTVTCCAVSTLCHCPLPLASARRPNADRHELPADGGRRPRVSLSARRWDVEFPARVDGVARTRLRAIRPRRQCTPGAALVLPGTGHAAESRSGTWLGRARDVAPACLQHCPEDPDDPPTPAHTRSVGPTPGRR